MDRLREEIERILSRPKGTALLVEREGMQAVALTPANFHPVKSESGYELIAVDGGQAVLLSTPDILVGMLRVAAIRQSGESTQVLAREEQFVVISTKTVQGKLAYEARVLDEKSPHTFIIDPHEAGIRDGQARAQLSKALEVLRRCSEFALARRMLKENACLVALDGEIEARAILEQQELAKLREAARGKLLAGVVKSTSLVTDHGAALYPTLQGIAPPGAWYYWPIARTDDIDWVISRLHDEAAITLRIDIPVECAHRALIIATLSAASAEISFPGYPYALLVADQFGRISNEEASQRRATLMLSLSVNVQEDAHAVLDRIVHRLGKSI